MKRKNTVKKVLIAILAVVLATAMALSIWYVVTKQNAEPVVVMPFTYVGMTEYWGDNQESYGPVSTDRIQTVYLSGTQTVTEILVQAGDTVKKGDVLMSFDTTLSDLALERKRLEVEKLKLNLEDAKDRLQEINAMVPMVIPVPSPDPEPSEPENMGLPLAGRYQIVSGEDHDGSSPEMAIICWLGSQTPVTDELFQVLLETARQLQERSDVTEPTQPKEPEPSEVQTEPSGTKATDATEPSRSDGTGPAETDPTEPTRPEEVEVNSFHVIFKITLDDMSLGQTMTWQGLLVSRNVETDGFHFQFVDVSGIQDPTQEQPEEPDVPEIDFGSGYTAYQIAQMRSEQEKTIKDLTFNIKMAEAEYKIMQTETGDGKVYATIDGTVVSLLTPEEAQISGQPLLKVSGGGGFYISGSISELARDTLQIGQEVTVNDWYSGMTYVGTISAINDYPTDEQNYSGGNPNVSYYGFTVFVDGSADLMEGNYVSMQYASADVSNGIFLENPYLRTEGGRSYVYIQGQDGTLEKRFVTTGRSLWGSYVEILSGLSETDLIAFPYGKNVTPGAQTVEGDPSDLYY